MERGVNAVIDELHDHDVGLKEEHLWPQMQMQGSGRVTARGKRATAGLTQHVSAQHDRARAKPPVLIDLYITWIHMFLGPPRIAQRG